MICPLHKTPLNSDGACLPCALAEGLFSDRVKGTDKETEHNYYQKWAQDTAKQAVEEVIALLEEQNRD